MMNRVDLIGNVGSEGATVRYTPNGTAVANMSIATNEKWTDRDGQKQERVEWHRVVVWGKLGEVCGEYLSKGRQVFVSGSLRTRKWEDRDGNTRYTTEIHAREVKFLGSRGESNNVTQNTQQHENTESAPEAELHVGEIPFG